MSATFQSNSSGKTSRLRMFHTIASHTSHHIGQVVMLRQLLGKWPLPAGGLTWQAEGLIPVVTTLIDAGHCTRLGNAVT
jgi:uncharacterized damage-inducible protein DinB